jgi:hypothetical protein
LDGKLQVAPILIENKIEVLSGGDKFKLTYGGKAL